MEGKVLNIKIPYELYDKLKEMADKKTVPVTVLIRLACTEYIESENRRSEKK